MTNFTGPEIEALLWAVELALDDQEHYLHCGNREMDYGDEWPESARAKAVNFQHMADAVQRFGATAVAERCEQLAREFQACTQKEGSPHDLPKL